MPNTVGPMEAARGDHTKQCLQEGSDTDAVIV
jgi:hypothetical protein